MNSAMHAILPSQSSNNLITLFSTEPFNLEKNHAINVYGPFYSCDELLGLINFVLGLNNNGYIIITQYEYCESDFVKKFWKFLNRLIQIYSVKICKLRYTNCKKFVNLNLYENETFTKEMVLSSEPDIDIHHWMFISDNALLCGKLYYDVVQDDKNFY